MSTNRSRGASRRIFLAVAVVAAALLAAGPSRAADRITVQLAWLKNAQSAGLFVADQKGFYRDAGVEVEFVAGGAGIDPLAMVQANPNEIGVTASSGLFINAVSRGAPLVAIGVMFQRHPNGFLVLENSPIRAFPDLAGRRIGVQPEGEYYLDVIASAYQLDKSKMEVMRVGYDPTPLLTGQLDAFMAWSINQPYAVEKVGGKWRFLLLADVPGIQLTANVMFVTRDLLKKNPDLIERWLRATLLGWSYAIDHVDETAEMVVAKYLPGGSVAAEKWALAQIASLVVSPETKVHGIGWIDQTKWIASEQTLLKYGQIQKLPDIDQTVNNELVTKAAVLR